MIIAVASGKGGTGKTTVTASLATIWDKPLLAVDLDVEEPNLHLFLRPTLTGSDQAYLQVPEVVESLCSHCGVCSDLCQFAAITVMDQVILTFPEMCHGCGGCLAICPEGAVFPGRRHLGDIIWGRAENLEFLAGKLRVGEAMGPPLMRLVKARLQQMLGPLDWDAIIDAPPGVSCPAISAVLDSDVIILVTEPTPFGVYDFQLAWEAFAPLNKPIGAVVNRAGLGGHEALYRFCGDKGLPILAEIPYARAIAEAYARGRIIAEVSPELRQTFLNLMGAVRHFAEKNQLGEATHA